MNEIDHFVTHLRDVECRICQKIARCALDRTLEDRAAYQGVPCPLPSVGVLGMYRHPELFTTPGGGEQLELWPLPADKPT